MAVNVEALQAVIRADVSDFDRGMRHVEEKLRQAGEQVQPVRVGGAGLRAFEMEMARLRVQAVQLRQALVAAPAGSAEARQLAQQLSVVERRMRLVAAASRDARGALTVLGSEGMAAIEALRARTERLQAVASRLTIAITAPILAGFGMAAREAMRYEQAIRNVNSISKMSEEQLGRVSAEVRDLAVEIGKMPQDLAEGLYDIASSGFQGAEGLEVLRQAAVGAKAGLATTRESAAAITAVLNAYGMSAEQASRVSDVMFKTVERGVLTYSELAGSIGNVISSAAAAGVSIEEVGAALATMTKAGINADESATALNRIIIAMLNPSKKLAEMIAAAGYSSGAAIIQTQGLAGAVEFLRQATGGSAEELAQLGMDARALKSALSLAREGGRVFAEDLEAMRRAAGATASALAEQERALGAQWERLRAQASVTAIAIGDSLAPTMRRLMELAGAAAAAFQQMSPGMQGAIVAVGGLAAAAGPALALLGQMTQGMAALRIAVAATRARLAEYLITLRAVATGEAAAGAGARALQLALGPVGLGLAAITGGLLLMRRAMDSGAAAEAETAARQVELAAGAVQTAERVRQLAGEFQELAEKSSRTRDESARMHEIFEQLRVLAPQLVRGFSDVGAAIAGAGTIAERAGKQFEEARRAQQVWEVVQLESQIRQLEERKLRLERARRSLIERAFAGVFFESDREIQSRIGDIDAELRALEGRRLMLWQSWRRGPETTGAAAQSPAPAAAGDLHERDRADLMEKTTERIIELTQDEYEARIYSLERQRQAELRRAREFGASAEQMAQIERRYRLEIEAAREEQDRHYEQIFERQLREMEEEKRQQLQAQRDAGEERIRLAQQAAERIIELTRGETAARIYGIEQQRQAELRRARELGASQEELAAINRRYDLEAQALHRSEIERAREQQRAEAEKWRAKIGWTTQFEVYREAWTRYAQMRIAPDYEREATRGQVRLVSPEMLGKLQGIIDRLSAQNELLRQNLSRLATVN